MQASNIVTEGWKITDLLIKHHHKLTGHSGRGITLNKICSSGYWIVDANSAVKNIIYNCVEYHRYRGRLREQKMAYLPSCRLSQQLVLVSIFVLLCLAHLGTFLYCLYFLPALQPFRFCRFILHSTYSLVFLPLLQISICMFCISIDVL